jgi:hypothetical protein
MASYATGFQCPSLANSSLSVDLGVVFAPNTGAAADSTGSMYIGNAGGNSYNVSGTSALYVPATGTYQVTFALVTTGNTSNTDVTTLIFGLSTSTVVTSATVINALPIYAGASNTFNAPYWYTIFLPLTKGSIYPYSVRTGNNNEYTINYNIWINQPAV